MVQPSCLISFRRPFSDDESIVVRAREVGAGDGCSQYRKPSTGSAKPMVFCMSCETLSAVCGARFGNSSMADDGDDVTIASVCPSGLRNCSVTVSPVSFQSKRLEEHTSELQSLRHLVC